MEVALSSFINRWALWKDYNFIYSHRVFFLIGLAFSRSLTSSTIVDVLSWYVTSTGYDIVKSAIVTNAHGLLSQIFVIFMAYAAHSFIGRFKTLLFSNSAYIGALVLFWKFHPFDVIWLLVVTLILLALGTSGDKVSNDALLDLVNDIDKSPDRNETRSIARANIWSHVACVLGSALAILLFVTCEFDSSWKSSYFICIITMSSAAIIYPFGHLYISRDFSSQDKPSKILDQEKGENEVNTQEISAPHLDTKGKEDTMNTCYKQGDNVVRKSLLKMLPICAVFTLVSTILATGSTFFLQQYSNLDTNNPLAVQLFNLAQKISSFAISYIYCWICCLPKNEKVKIGVGVLCGVVSCTFAWKLEVYRLKEVSHLVDIQEDTKTSVSFFWLIPQFCALGCMEGLTKDALLKFCKSQIKGQHLQRYREEYIELLKGIGMLLNMFLILACQVWFGDKINDSRLDRYYMVMICIGSANFITYCYIAIFLYKDQVLAIHDENSDNDDLQLDQQMEEIGNIEENLPRLSPDQEVDTRH